MRDEDKTKGRLINELADMRERVAELDTSQVDHKRAEKVLRKRTHELKERVKELNCLFAISNLVGKPGISLEEIFQRIVDLIPSAMRYPEIICARIIHEGQEFRTSNFKDTPCRQASDIVIHGEPIGALEVCYLEEIPDRDEKLFLREKKGLISSIVERLGRITERMRAEEALLLSEKRFRNLMENSPFGIFIFQNDKIVYENPEQIRLVGHLLKPFKPPYFRNLHPDDVQKVKQFYKKFISNEVRTLDMDFRFYTAGKMGNIRDMKWVYCRATSIEYLGEKAVFVHVIDLTQVRRLENLLKIEDKMSSLGRVAAGMAHEIRNPLSTINVYLDIFGGFCVNQEVLKIKNRVGIKESIAEIRSASNKIESVIKRVMDFAKPSAPKLVLTDINQCIKETIALSSVNLRKMGVKIETSLDKALPKFYLDSQALEHVLLNLITNAVEAMKGLEGPKRIEIRSSGNNPITIAVSDSGPGVPQDTIDKIFDPFYTTKDYGSGIGLSISHRIITDHGGSLNVSTSKWGGAEFRIFIPIAGKEKQ